MLARQTLSRWAVAAVVAAMGAAVSDAKASTLLVWLNQGSQNSNCPPYYAQGEGFDSQFNLVCNVATQGSTAGATCLGTPVDLATTIVVDTGSGYAPAQSQAGGACTTTLGSWSTIVSSSCTTAPAPSGYPSCPAISLQSAADGSN
jgi:hypothetical protein